jgi:hypothetical protein
MFMEMVVWSVAPEALDVEVALWSDASGALNLGFVGCSLR